VSDPHGINNFSKIDLPAADVLIVAGDLLHSYRGARSLEMIRQENELYYYNDLFGDLKYDGKYQEIIAVAGNHDWCLESHHYDAARLNNFVYLEGAATEWGGLKFYGFPWMPNFNDWAYMLPRNGWKLKAAVEMIPLDTDVLITHGPPMNTLDWVPSDKVNVGCDFLRERIMKMSQLKLHVFGHVHESYGHEVVGSIHFVNASQMDERYNMVNLPIVVEI